MVVVVVVGDYLPELCSNVVHLLLVLQDRLATAFKQQRGHTEPVLIEAFKLQDK